MEDACQWSKFIPMTISAGEKVFLMETTPQTCVKDVMGEYVVKYMKTSHAVRWMMTPTSVVSARQAVNASQYQMRMRHYAENTTDARCAKAETAVNYLITQYAKLYLQEPISPATYVLAEVAHKTALTALQ